MVSIRNKNTLQGPKLDDYVCDLPELDEYLKIKLKIPKNINDRITWQQFEDDIINSHINEYIVQEDGELKTQFPDGLDSIRDQIANTCDFFVGKIFSREWNEIAFKIWNTHKENYTSVLSFMDRSDLVNRSDNGSTLPTKYHYLSTKSQTLISLKDLLSKRKPIHIKKRWLNVLDPYLKKGKWSEEEDALLIEKYKQFGPHWSKIALEIPRRTVDQCSKRFLEALDPDRSMKNHVDWSIKEDLLLITKLKLMGSKWRAIALKLDTNRSALNCRNRWRKIINGYIKGKCNGQVAALIDDLSKDGQFEDIVKLREEIEMKKVEKVERKINKAKKRNKHTNKKVKTSEGDDEDISDDYGYEDEDEEGEDERHEEEMSDVEPPYVLDHKNSDPSKNETTLYAAARNSLEPENSLTSNSILISENNNRPAPSLVSNFLEQQFDQQQFSGSHSMQPLSPGNYHMSMSPPPNLPLGILQTPKPHDIISSLRTTQLPTVNMNPITNVSNNTINNNISNNPNKFYKNSPVQALSSETALNKSMRPSSVPLKSNNTEWKFQLKQKNLTLSSGNITSERLVSLLIEQAKLNNLKISIHQHIHNHYMPILDNSEQGSSRTSTPGSDKNNHLNGSKGQASVMSNNSSLTSNNNIAGSFGTKVIKDLNEIGAYRVKHFKQLNVKKVPKLASSSSSSTKRRNGSVTGSSPGSISRKKVKFNNHSNNANSNNNTNNNSLNNSARSSVVGSNEYENDDESFDFWDSLMQSNPLSHMKGSSKADNTKNSTTVKEKKFEKHGKKAAHSNSNELEYYMLGFNPS